MVKELHKNEETLYEGEECHFKYRDKEWAEKCKTWCAEHQSYNLKIIQHAITQEGGDTHG